MPNVSREISIRLAAFRFLQQQTEIYGDTLSRDLLARGFRYEDQQIRLIGPQGIFKPATLEVPISITTVPIVSGKERPYEDEFGENGVIRYRYRGKDSNHPDNVGLRVSMEHQLPLVYNFGVVPGRYVCVWPVYIVGDSPDTLVFHVQVEDVRQLDLQKPAGEIASHEAAVPGHDRAERARREYVTVEVKQRLHQAGFRAQVLRAYRKHCAICRLRHEELLDAAHIIPDSQGGEPVVSNGLALCKLHHAAFDRNILGIRPDLVVQVNRRILEEEDGPMLLHGLQNIHGTTIRTPARRELRPSEDNLTTRFDAFLAAQ